MIRKTGFRIVVPASEEHKIQGGRRSVQDMINVHRRKQQKGWSLNPRGCQAGSKLLPWAVLSLLSPAVKQPDGQWLVVYPGPTCRTNIKDFLNSSQLAFVGLTKETLTKWFCFCFKIVPRG